ncbi:MAG: hypothetical protein ACQEXJ_06270 [Myxococcota bacterium]
MKIRPLVLATMALLPVACQGSVEEPSAELRAVGLGPLVDADTSETTPAAVEAVRGARGDDPDARIGLSWSFEPPALQVYRSTAVHFRLDEAPEGHESASCTWKFGDGSTAEEGCNVSHTFHGGQADQVVTLTLRDGDWSWTSTKTVPLERLPVVEGLLEDEEQALDGLPAPPEEGETSFRFAVVADSAANNGVPADVGEAVDILAEQVRPGLVIHAGGVVLPEAGDEAWDGVRGTLVRPLQHADIPVAFATAAGDRQADVDLPRPDLQMIDDRHYPERYTFTHKGAFFLVFSPGEDGVPEETLVWMREQLSKARVYEARYVVSHLPLHKFGDEHLGSLDKKFRLYELFLRARVTTLFSAGYRVYFKGRYGALPVVSVGALAAPGGTLSGADFSQPPSFVVVDQVKGAPERVFAVVGPTFDLTLDESTLPETVEVYTR